MNTDRCPPPDWCDDTERDDQAPYTVASAPAFHHEGRLGPSSVDNVDEDVAVDRLLDALKSSPVRFTFLCDRMSLARAHGDLPESEREEIYALARTLSIDATQVSALEEWVRHVQSERTPAPDGDDDSPTYSEVLAERLEEADIPIGAVAATCLGGKRPR